MKYFVLAISCAIVVGCNEASKPERTDVTVNKPPAEPSTARAQPDNTAVNARDRDKTTKTPIDQTENKADLTTTADIRKRVVDGKMSIDAQNVKIMTQDGKVTLRGPVKSADEKQRIEKIATEVAGSGNVRSELEVEAPK